jgi:hypothetical protein
MKFFLWILYLADKILKSVVTERIVEKFMIACARSQNEVLINDTTFSHFYTNDTVPQTDSWRAHWKDVIIKKRLLMVGNILFS